MKQRSRPHLRFAALAVFALVALEALEATAQTNSQTNGQTNSQANGQINRSGPIGLVIQYAGTYQSFHMSSISVSTTDTDTVGFRLRVRYTECGTEKIRLMNAPHAYDYNPSRTSNWSSVWLRTDGCAPVFREVTVEQVKSEHTFVISRP